MASATGSSVVPFVEKVPRKSNVTEIIPPVDFSFLHLTNVDDCRVVEPRDVSPRREQPIKIKKILEDGETKYLSQCLRINNNHLTDLIGLMPLAVSLFDNALNIGWIDLSFNMLTIIDPVLTQFENLKILYLHGNHISELKEVIKLSSLKKLWKLTLHGNDIENIKGYRQYVLSKIPTLVNFDFSTVTKGDRLTSDTWMAFNNPARKQFHLNTRD